VAVHPKRRLNQKFEVNFYTALDAEPTDSRQSVADCYRSASELHRVTQSPYDMPTEGHKVAPNTGNEITECTVRARLATGWTVRGSNPGGAKFSAPVQTGPGAHTASYTMGTGSISRG